MVGTIRSLFVTFLIDHVSSCNLNLCDLCEQEMVYDSQWKLRKSVWAVVVIVWVAYFYSYRDINRENNRLLLELKHHLLTLTTTNIATSGENYHRVLTLNGAERVFESHVLLNDSPQRWQIV